MSMFFWVKKVVPALIVSADGSGDYTDIQSAIDALPATGGQIFVKAGVYTITAAITINKPDVSIVGAGHSTKIQTTAAIIMIHIGNTTTANRFILDSLFLYGNSTGAQYGIVVLDGTDGKIMRCFIDNMGSNALNIEMASSSNQYIYENTITNNGLNGILISEADDCIIKDNIVKSNVGSGIYISKFLNTSDRNIITGNIVRSNDKGIYISTNNVNNIITSNVFENNTTANIDDNGTGTVLDNNVTT